MTNICAQSRTLALDVLITVTFFYNFFGKGQRNLTNKVLPGFLLLVITRMGNLSF